jgi:hypothetical protein
LVAAWSTQSPRVTVQSYPLLANSHIPVDLNGDGILDLAGPGANGAAVMLGNTNGTFNAPVDVPNSTGLDAPVVVAPDVNNDTRLDLLLAP